MYKVSSDLMRGQGRTCTKLTQTYTQGAVLAWQCRHDKLVHPKPRSWFKSPVAVALKGQEYLFSLMYLSIHLLRSISAALCNVGQLLHACKWKALQPLRCISVGPICLAPPCTLQAYYRLANATRHSNPVAVYGCSCN